VELSAAAGKIGMELGATTTPSPTLKKVIIPWWLN